MKISKRTRADAIAICEQRHDPANMRYTASDLAEHIGAVGQIARVSDGPAYRLAFDAWRVAAVPESWLEASGILRDGWRPGDPVEARP